MVTCGHLYAPKPDGVNVFDISNNHDAIQIRVDYENENCNETKTRYGKLLKGYFNRIMLGTSYDKDGDPNTYEENEDYAVLQASKTIDKFANYNILYAGWSSNYDITNFNNTGYAAIGHPKSDVKKVNIENHRAWANSDYFALYFDQGVSEHGFSGSPVFNSSKEVIGWLCTGEGDCTTIGQDNFNNRTTCGRFDDLHFSLMSYIDPSNIGEAISSNPIPPTPPSHCTNCIQDQDETGIDCGGSCYPCGMQDVVTIKTPMDIPGSVKSRYELFAEPDPNTLLVLKGGSYSLEAGMNIYLKGGFVVEKGATFYAGIDSGLMSEADRGCQDPCMYPANIFTPNGDGINDFWKFSQAFVDEYDLIVKDQYGSVVFTSYNQPIYENGIVQAWDGSGSDPNSTYFEIELTYLDCNGNSHFYNSFTHSYKSAIIGNNYLSEVTKVENDKVILNYDTKIEIYPNPVMDNITINYSGKIFPLEYKVMDLNGKVIINNKTNGNHQLVDLKNIAAGTYIINAKAGEYNLVQKLIKK